MKRNIFFVVAIFILWCSYIVAQNMKDAQEERFNKSHPENFIATAQQNMAKKEMDLIYKCLLELFAKDKGTTVRLQQTQAAWEKYCDLQIKSELAFYSGGWPESTELAISYAGLLNERITRLKILLKEEYSSRGESKRNVIKETIFKKIKECEDANKKEYEDNIKKYGIRKKDYEWLFKRDLLN